MTNKERSERTKSAILEAATQQFALKGIYGARIDEIAKAAGVNKRMIYAYFENKEGLYKAVLFDEYLKLEKRELMILDDNEDCVDAIRRIIREYFIFLHNNLDFVNLMMWENLNKASYMKEFDAEDIKEPVISIIKSIIQRGKRQGIFKKSVDEQQVVLSLIMFSFSYFSNQYTLSKLFNTDLYSKKMLEKRVLHVTDIMLGYLCN